MPCTLMQAQYLLEWEKIYVNLLAFLQHLQQLWCEEGNTSYTVSEGEDS